MTVNTPPLWLQSETSNIVAEIALRIRQSLQLDEILNTAVEEVRSLLETDRVVIYKFLPDWSGEVVVESVSENWRPIIHQVIHDTCFKNGWDKPYRLGHVSAIEDIENCTIHPCYVELLQSLQVRANFVVPILQKPTMVGDDENLWGLLIAHHCRGPRKWQTTEVDILTELCTQLAIAIKQAEMHHKLQEELNQRQRAQAELIRANDKIQRLNQRLKIENSRLNAELDITRQLQEIIVPTPAEIQAITQLDIATYMKPAAEVGGDYYDILQHQGRVKIGIGDVTGHGLESGILMMMVQTAVRTLLNHNETDIMKFLKAINSTIYDNVERMNCDKNLTLMLLDYCQGFLEISGQHEQAILLRSGDDPQVEIIDTIDLGFPIGLEPDISQFIHKVKIKLNSQDVLILFTDGITEAENSYGEHYGIDRLCEVALCNHQQTSEEIKNAIVSDVYDHIGRQRIFDDITLIIVKQK
ncbi:MAG: GAF domain-containing protein [Arthrospira sp. PLM2.Bin9]|nr:GAF domain-containing SpoIIE family protein phosphatase [Arthrospira sp. PLM2.Bin9]TVU55037.1 MAG: GAF domain-containing protein [Arthrospira sp. PLM2.Bin9]